MGKLEIRHAAWKLFCEQGYEASSMDDIARAVGIKKPSLYAHFPSKEAIFKGLFDEVIDGYATHVAGLLAGWAHAPSGGGSPPERSPRDLLLSLAESYVEAFLDPDAQKFWYRLTMAPPAFIKDELFARLQAADLALAGELEAFFAREHTAGALKAADPGIAALAFLSMAGGLAMMTAFYTQSGDWKAAVAGCVDLFWKGVAP
jgi:AcrR family transcriptional regulator